MIGLRLELYQKRDSGQGGFFWIHGAPPRERFCDSFHVITKFIYVYIHIALIQYKVFKGNETETFCPLAFELVFANFIFLHKTYIPILSIFSYIFKRVYVDWDKLYKIETLFQVFL